MPSATTPTPALQPSAEASFAQSEEEEEDDDDDIADDAALQQVLGLQSLTLAVAPRSRPATGDAPPTARPPSGTAKPATAAPATKATPAAAAPKPALTAGRAPAASRELPAALPPDVQLDTRGDPVLEAIQSGDLGSEATIRALKAKLRAMQVGLVGMAGESKRQFTKLRHFRRRATR